MPLGIDRRSRRRRSGARLGWGRLTGKIRRGQPLPKSSRLQSKVAADIGPQVPDEYLIQRRRRPGRSREGNRQDRSADRAQLAAAAPDRGHRHHRRAQRRAASKQNLGAVGWNLTKDQVAKLDAASAVKLAYPYWHQRFFPMLNPAPV